MNIKLRKATYADIDLLYQWANDPIVRQGAFHTEPIPYEDHVKWFEKMMADENVYQYILCGDNEEIGQIRLNQEDSQAIISYSISKEYRGKGYGSQMLKLIEVQAKEDITDIKELVGLVKYTNPASMRAFEKCGYEKCELPDYIQYRRKVAE